MLDVKNMNVENVEKPTTGLGEAFLDGESFSFSFEREYTAFVDMEAFGVLEILFLPFLSLVSEIYTIYKQYFSFT